MKSNCLAQLFSFCLLPSAFCLSAAAQGTAFTYQGRLITNGSPATGSYDLRFAIYDSTNQTYCRRQSWNFKDLHDGRHMGPMAQDFYAAFGLGNSDRTITSVDPDGVELAAIQGLNQKLEEQARVIEAKVA